MIAGTGKTSFCVIADDLTGAMDTGVGLAQAGLSPIIAFSTAARVTSDALVITTDSRAVSPDEAYRRVKSIAAQYSNHFIYKKVDSTLRGNVAVELQALLDASRVPHAVVCPAFPAIKRTVVNGNLLVGGIPVHRTDFARDPVSPVTRSSIVELLQDGAHITASNVQLADVERGPRHLAELLCNNGSRVSVVDAVEDKHLRCIADAVAANVDQLLPCGSGGLGAHIPLAFGYSALECPLPPSPGGPALLAVGSRNDISIRQLLRVIDAMQPPLVRIEPGEFESKAGRGPRTNLLARDIRQLLASNSVVILSSSLSEYAPHLRHILARVMGAIVTRVLATTSLGGLFLSGGDVARSVCGEHGIEAIRILGDLQPGVIVGEADGARYAGLRVITKAGGFGNEDAMLQAIEHFVQGATQ